MKKLFSSVALLVLTGCASLLFAKEIDLQTDQKTITAPEGENYSWYHDGVLQMGENNESLTPKKSGVYAVVYTDTEGKEVKKSITLSVTQQGIKKIYIIGDSTVANYKPSNYPQMGWGQVLSLFFDDAKFEIANRAIGGRSSRSFHEQGWWTKVRDVLQEGDYVFIQWGHNDRDYSKAERYTDTAQYKTYLRLYVNETRARKAIPVLISPMILNAWSGSRLRNVFTEGANDYHGAMLQVATELDVLFVDLNMRSFDLINSVGLTYAKEFLFMQLQAGEYPNYADGHGDGGTHFQEMGALNMARLITEGLSELGGQTGADDLIEALQPLYQVDVEANVPDPGLITIPGKYPEGAHVTVKHRAPLGTQFLSWQDAQETTISEEILTSFEVGAKDYVVRALFKDCNGTIGGSGYLDPCQSCIDETAQESPCIAGVRGDKACKWGGGIVIDSAETYVNYLATPGNNAGDTITYTVTTGGSGTYDLGLTYRTSQQDLAVDIYVNEAYTIPELSLPPSETAYNKVFFPLDLRTGNNYITLVLPETTHTLDIAYFTINTDNAKAGTSCRTVNLVTPLGIKDGKNQVFAFPNPFTDQLFIRTEAPVSYQILSINGSILFEGSCDNACQIEQNLKPGTYLINIIQGQWSDSQLIFKK